jgi:hypothetical protein
MTALEGGHLVGKTGDDHYEINADATVYEAANEGIDSITFYLRPEDNLSINLSEFGEVENIALWGDGVDRRRTVAAVLCHP